MKKVSPDHPTVLVSESRAAQVGRKPASSTTCSLMVRITTTMRKRFTRSADITEWLPVPQIG
jgi:hypothetical protein